MQQFNHRVYRLGKNYSRKPYHRRVRFVNAKYQISPSEKLDSKYNNVFFRNCEPLRRRYFTNEKVTNDLTSEICIREAPQITVDFHPVRSSNF